MAAIASAHGVARFLHNIDEPGFELGDDLVVLEHRVASLFDGGHGSAACGRVHPKSCGDGDVVLKVCRDAGGESHLAVYGIGQAAA